MPARIEDGDGEDDEKESWYSRRTAPQIVVFLSKNVLSSQEMPGVAILPGTVGTQGEGIDRSTAGTDVPGPNGLTRVGWCA